MFSVSRCVSFTIALTLSSASVFAQSVISAKSGLVHYIEGDVSVDAKPVSDKVGVFADVKKGGELTTGLGRAEVLLTPGVFLRVGEQSAFRMQETSLQDTRVEFESGKVMVESDTPMKDNLVTIVYKDYATTFRTHGLYEFQSEPAQLKVYAGEAQVTAGGQTVIVKEGRILVFTAALAEEKFNPKEGDALYRWSKLRSEYVSVANVSAAKSARDDGYFSSYSGTSSGSWFYNPFYSMYTYLPFGGTAFSPFGFGYYSPFTVWRFYNSGGGYSGGYSNSGSNYSSYRSPSQSSVVAAAVSSSAAAPSRSSGVSAGSVGGGMSSPGGHAGGHGH
jgi:hypothetical protein